MRLCANENVPAECVAALRQRGDDVLWIREAARGCDDNAVLAAAQAGGRILITFDKGFGDLFFTGAKMLPAASCCSAFASLPLASWRGVWSKSSNPLPNGTDTMQLWTNIP